MPSPQAPHDVRLRKMLTGPIAPPSFPAGYILRSFAAADAHALHALLVEVFDDGSDGPFDVWWPRLAGDPEFDPALTFLVFTPDERLLAAAICWNTAFVKDLAVRQHARRQGLGGALMLHVFAIFIERGAAHVDLKTSLVANADAVRLYRKLGMVEVDWGG